MLPSIFGENLFDDFFSDPFEMMMPQSRNPLYGKHAKNLMKTDVRETENSFEVDMDLPGFKKDEVNLELKAKRRFSCWEKTSRCIPTCSGASSMRDTRWATTPIRTRRGGA